MQKDIDNLVSQHVIPGTQSAITKIAGEQKVIINKVDGTEIDYAETNKILIPKTIDKLQAAWNLVREYQNEETYKEFSRSFPWRFTNDFLSTVNRLIKEEFGAVIQSPSSALGKSAINHELIIPLKYNERGTLITEPAFIGSVVATPWGNAIMDININGSLVINAKTKYAAAISAFFAKVETKLTSESVVRGTAVELDPHLDGTVWTKPVKVKINDGIFLEETVDRIVNNLIIPSMGEKKKKAILLTGDFGTGKTETAIKIGKRGLEDFGRTFFYLKNAQQFNLILSYLSSYPRSTVFIEDIDQMVDGDRGSELNEILNSIDGAALKYADVTFLFTTNAHDKINPAMRRPGRIDEVVHFDYCTPKMIEQIYRYHLGGMPAETPIDFNEAAGYTPAKLQGAIITEIAIRAKKYATQLHNGTLSTDVLKDAIASMKEHIKFMRAPQEKNNTVEEAIKLIGNTANAEFASGMGVTLRRD